MINYDIPDKYADKLELVEEVTETRTDEEILALLHQYVPVTSEKNIWAFWHGGLMAMPAWCQRNAIDWFRICNGAGWTIRVLDNIPDSPNYALRHLAAQDLPQCFVERTMDGPYVGQHSADFTRGAAIYQHGGVWMDVGSIMIRHIEPMCWDALCDPDSPYKVATVWKDGQWIFNYFVAARKGDPFIRRWHDVFLHIWEGRVNHDGIARNPLFHYIVEILMREQEEARQKAQEEEKENKEKQERELAEKADQQQSEEQPADQQQHETEKKEEMDKDEDNNKPKELQATGDLAFLDWKVPMHVLMDYASQIAAWHRVASLEDVGDGFSGVDYWTNHMLLLDFGETTKPMKFIDNKNGDRAARTLKLMSMQRFPAEAQEAEPLANGAKDQSELETKDTARHQSEGVNVPTTRVAEQVNGDNVTTTEAEEAAQKEEAREPTPEEQEALDRAEAEQAVWESLAHGSFTKIAHSKDLTHSKQLGVLLDEEDNAGKDRAPGSFMALLRYGTVRFRQKRATPEVRAAPRPKHTLRKGLLEV